MATSRLPVYNKMRQLFVQFAQSTRKLPINVKRGPIAKIENELIEMLVGLSYADEASEDASAQERLDFIDDVEKMLRDVKIRVRVLHDLKFIKDKGFNALTKLEDNATGQLVGWRKTTESRIEKQ